MKNLNPFELLLSLPPNMCRYLTDCAPMLAERAFATFDPPDQQLGSGGGTTYLLEQAWRASGEESFDAWLAESGKLIIHGGGESRRLPAYAPSGKLFMPLPVFRWSTGQRLDQTLLDLAEPLLRKITEAATVHSRVLIASGDVLVHSDQELPPVPEADVVLFGLWVKPEEAQNFGVLFCDRHHPEKLVSFLQKPTPETIREKSRESLFLVDVGIWMLSERAVKCLLKKTGWDSSAQVFGAGIPDSYDLYGQWALSLGENPVEVDAEIASLSTAVVPLSDAGFYHFGTGCDMVQSMYALQNLEQDQTKLGNVSTLAQPRQFVQNALFQAPLRREENHSLWVENSHIPSTWTLSYENILTGIPQNDWVMELEPGVCLDMVPVEGDWVLRVYGYSDPFRGALDDPETLWLGDAPMDWFEKRGISFAEAGLDSKTDLQQAALFPRQTSFDAGFIKWMFAKEPAPSELWKELWLQSVRFSARELAQKANLPRLCEQRRKRCQEALPLMAKNAQHSVFYSLDLEVTAQFYAESEQDLFEPLDVQELRNPLIALHDRMFRAAVCRHRGEANWEEHEKEAFGVLRNLIVKPFQKVPVHPVCTLLDEQIVWGRCPVRLDFAGGWTDTPPYCLEHGGTVLNMAVELNGQPPIQVFARKIPAFKLVIRSIDLGLVEELNTYEEVRAYDQLSSGFTVARAAFALAGFHPLFNGKAFQTLEEQLEVLGGGIEISMLAAIPKGSGLGTSSMLSATLLGVLSNFAELHWDHDEIIQRALALEQMLTSGGGWQDQVGGVLPGVKLITTSPGLNQFPVSRWLPSHFFQGPEKGRMLLYYTGLTRVARNILSEIVRGIFLNSSSRLATLKKINQNAEHCFDALQRNDFNAFAQGVQESWLLNQELDPGTNTPEVQAILDQVAEDLCATKLLGAGGGGYLFMIAKDFEAAIRIREKLENTPPNRGARFVEFDLSQNGLQITRS